MPKYSPTISPGQGLLLLIDHYKNDPIKVDKLKKLYLSGAETTADAEEISTKANINKHSNEIKFLACPLTNSLIL